MRQFLFPLVLLVTVTAGCRCVPANPQPVTMRVINTTRAPIYVDGTGGKFGLTVKRDVGGMLYGFDDLACECRFCSNACTAGCSCPDAGVANIRRIEPGSTLERTWNGVVQTSGFSNCSADACLDQQNAPLNEPFTLELCFNVRKPTGVVFDDAGVGSGTFFDQTATCTTKQFAPQDLTVEIGPAVGSACATTADCKGSGELCFDGACTSGCPANDFPATGAEWVLTIANPDNMGFFEQSARGTKATLFTGTGTLVSAVYQSGTLQLSFSRPGLPGELLTGRVQVKLPLGTGVPLEANTPVKVLVVDDGAENPSRALVLRNATTNEVLFAADMGQNARTLEPADLAPFAVSDGDTPIGCSLDVCGRLLYFPLRLSAGAQSVEVLPGATGQLTLGATKYSFLNVSSGKYETTRCPVSDLRPYFFWMVTTP
ncbi:MAG: hypothetical protein ACOZQL_10995 [Myxococcota bacterium]